MLTSSIRRTAPYPLFGILVCLFLWRPIFTGRALLPGDYLAQMLPWKSVIKPVSPPPQWNPMQWDAIAQFYPWRVFYARSIRAGHMPLWNPHQFCGTPFLANGQSAVLYPLNLVYVVTDPITATTLYAALHLFLAMVFMYLLMRELERSAAAGIIGAVVFTFSAFMVLWLELPTFVGSAVWLPLALTLAHRAVRKRSAFCGMLSGAAMALSFLAGHFQIAFYVLLAAQLWWLWNLVSVLSAEGKHSAMRQVVVPFAACLVTFALLSAPQVLPTIELARDSHRVREVTPEGYARFVGNALPLYRLVTAFVPDFYGNPSRHDYYLLGNLNGHVGSAADYMEYGMYAGILPLMLAGVGLAGVRKLRHAGFFAVLAIFALLIAAGTHLNALFYYVIPGFSALGGPNRMLLLYLFGVAGLAAFGFDAVRVTCEPTKVRGALWLLPVLMLTVLTLLLAVASTRDMPPPTGPAVRLSAALLFASGILLIARWNAGVCRGSFAALATVLTVADLFAFGINYNPTCDRSKVYPRTELTDQLRTIAGAKRIAPINPKWSLFKTPEAILPPNGAMVYGLYDAQGYDSLYTRDYKDLIDRVQGQDSSPIENGNMVLVKRPKRELGTIAEYVLAAGPIDAPAGLSRVFEANGVTVYRIDGADAVQLPKPAVPSSFRLGMYLMSAGLAAIVFFGASQVFLGKNARG